MNRLINARLFLAIGIAMTIGAVEVGSLTSSVRVEPAATMAVSNSDRIPMLPTISVRPPNEIPTLPLVVVRPTQAQLDASPETVTVASTSPSASSRPASTAVPHVRLDMPYYSFGKMLPNVIKD